MIPIQLAETIVAGRRLGRHIDHDERSWSFPAPRAETLVTTMHNRVAPIFDQGQLGSCTGNAMAGLLGTDPFAKRLPTVNEDEALAVRIYELGTQLDDIAGAYPPQDTGSSGLAVAKAAQQLGYITAYQHAFGLDHALAALVLAPVIIGIPWMDSFDTPGPGGLLTIAPGAKVRGGHELELVGLDVEKRLVRGANSWGTSWGDSGYFSMQWDTFDALLRNQGDVVTVS